MGHGGERRQEVPNWLLLLIFSTVAVSSTLYGSLFLALPGALGLPTF